jgi:hypothetical protein
MTYRFVERYRLEAVCLEVCVAVDDRNRRHTWTEIGCSLYLSWFRVSVKMISVAWKRSKKEERVPIEKLLVSSTILLEQMSHQGCPDFQSRLE